MFRRSANKTNACVTGIFISLFSFLHSLFLLQLLLLPPPPSQSLRVWSVCMCVCAIFILKFTSYFMSIDFTRIDGNYIRPMNEQIFVALFVQSNRQQQKKQQKYAQNICLKKPLKLHVTCIHPLACVFHPSHCVYFKMSLTFSFFFTSFYFIFCFALYHLNSIFGWVCFRTIYSLLFLSCIFFYNRFYNEEELQRPACALSLSRFHSFSFSSFFLSSSY